MNVGNSSGEGEVMVEMNTTPLIDVMLVLLTLLIITLPIQTHAVKLDMPKPNKLPPPVVSVDYALEYGKDRLEARNDALRPGERVLIVDDVLATGGTLDAACRLVETLGAVRVGASVVIELEALQGRHRLPGNTPLHALLRY